MDTFVLAEGDALMTTWPFKSSLPLVACWFGFDASVPVEKSAPNAHAMSVSLSDDHVDEDPSAPPLCHLVTPVTVLNCANSSSTCVTEITPNYTCQLVILGPSDDPYTACRCRKP